MIRIGRGIIAALLVTAYPALAYDGWSGASTVKSLRNYLANYVLVQMATAENPGQCSNTQYYYLPQDGTEERKRQYVPLLSAFHTGATVNLALSGCSAGALSGYPVIEQVWLIAP